MTRLSLLHIGVTMHKVNIHKAKTQFSKLVESAINGKKTIIAKSGKPVAKIVPIISKKPKRRPGMLKGKIKIADDFDAPLSEDILGSFAQAITEPLTFLTADEL